MAGSPVGFVQHAIAAVRALVRMSRLPAPLFWFTVVALLWLARRWLLARRCRALTASRRTGSRLSGRGDGRRHFVILCVGTRGDVQPFVALARGLMSRGHSVTMCTCGQFRGFVESHGIRFVSCGVERVKQGPEWLSATSMSQFVRASAQAFADSMPAMGEAAWSVCKGGTAGDGEPPHPPADVILANLFAQHFGLDLAEALHVPCWLLKLCPDEPTRCTPPFGERPSRWGWLNLARHYLRLATMVRAAGQTNFTALQNRIRRDVFGLRDVGVARLTEMGHTPTLHGFSGQLLPKPRDWGDWLMMSGFFFLDAQPGYTPPPDVAAFVAAGPKPVCVTFGSMSVLDTTDVVDNAVRAVLKLGHRCVLIGGWTTVPKDLPSDRVCVVKEIPHDWLFPLCSAVVYHGGAGTFARVAQSGVPSVIVPILRFFDQPGWGDTAEGAGIGVRVRGDPTVPTLVEALRRVTPVMATRAAEVGATLRREDGVTAAVQQLESCLCARVKATPAMFTPAVDSMCDRNCVACNSPASRS